ncbi:PBP2_Bug_TTT domain containing protein [Rhabdaerophilaceae bacterium]
MITFRLRWGALVIAGLLALGNASPAVAQEYPAKAITLVVPFPPGGSTDIAGRFLGEKMSEILKQPIIVENRAGAAGAVGIRAVANAQPDGYTLGVSGVGPSAILLALGRDIGYDPTGLTYIGHMGSTALLLGARKDLMVKSLADLTALAKSKPGILNFGTSGAGSPGHLAMELLLSKAGVTMNHVPYQGNAPLLNDLIGRHVDIGVLTMPGTPEHVKNGKVQGIVALGGERTKDLPDLPTVKESGVPDYAVELWNVLVGPKGLPQPVVERLAAALSVAMADPEVRRKLETSSIIPVTMSPSQARDLVEREKVTWTAVVKAAGSKVK